jgi:hypothetical protein
MHREDKNPATKYTGFKETVPLTLFTCRATFNVILLENVPKNQTEMDRYQQLGFYFKQKALKTLA